MTKTEAKYGSLSKTLDKFLDMNAEEREKNYGKNKAKLYERVVKNVQESFNDAVFAYNRLPSQYTQKIDLNMGFNMIQQEIFKQKSPKDRASFAISQARNALMIIETQLSYGEHLVQLFGDDFARVQKWLSLLDSHEPVLKEHKIL